MAKKYFFDTEFIEYPNTIQLISIGIVSESGHEYYAVCSDYNYDDANDWVKKNVIRPMFEQAVKGTDELLYEHNFHKKIGKTGSRIAQEILEYIGDEKPDFWAYYGSYDWVVFCWLYGAMIDLPKNFPMYCNDVKQLMDMYNLDKLPDPENEHNALADAKWTKDQFYHFLEQNDALKELL